MDPNDMRTPAKYRGVRITSGVVLAAVIVLIAVLLVLLLTKTGVIPPSFLHSLLGNGEAAEQTEEVGTSVLPDFSADSAAAVEHYYTFSVDPRETLAALTERDSYVREFRVINSYGGEADSQKYTLTVSGDRCRLESDFKTVLCDGTTTCTITDTYRTKLDGTVFTPENEIGITSLEDVKAMAEKGSVTYPSRSSDNKTLLIVAENAESGILYEFAVSVETGIVMAERSYIGGEMYRAVITDSVDIFGADFLPDSYFEIPMEP